MTYLEGRGDTDEVQILLLHSLSCGDKSHTSRVLFPTLDCPCRICVSQIQPKGKGLSPTDSCLCVPILDEKASVLLRDTRESETQALTMEKAISMVLLLSVCSLLTAVYTSAL